MVYTSFNRRVMNEDVENVFDNIDTSGISDNIEEATSNLLYETEVNWNSLMQAVGIAELAEMDDVGEVIYEAVDIKAFFGKVKEFFKGLLDKIARIFKKMIETVQNWFNSIKKTFYDNKFKNLTSVPEGFTYEGYEFTIPVTDMLYSTYKIWETEVSQHVDELDGHSISSSLAYDDEDPDTIISILRDRIAILNNHSVKKKLIDSMRSYLLLGNLNGDYDWNKEIFKHFRSGKEKPEEITAKDIDIAAYKTTINDHSVVQKIAKDCYKSLERDVEHAVYSLTTDANANKYLAKLYREDGKTKDADYQECVVQLVQIRIKYAQEYLNSATSVYSGMLKALADQSKQCYGALVKMLQMPKSSNNSENDKTTNEDFDMTHSLLDNVNFI